MIMKDLYRNGMQVSIVIVFKLYTKINGNTVNRPTSGNTVNIYDSTVTWLLIDKHIVHLRAYRIMSEAAGTKIPGTIVCQTMWWKNYRFFFCFLFYLSTTSFNKFYYLMQ